MLAVVLLLTGAAEIALVKHRQSAVVHMVTREQTRKQRKPWKYEEHLKNDLGPVKCKDLYMTHNTFEI